MFGKVDKSVHEAVLQERDTALASLEALTGEKSTLTEQLTTLTTERDQAIAQLTEAQSTIADLQSQITDLNAKLANRPGVDATNVAPTEEKIETQEAAPVAADPVTEFASEKF